MTRILQEKQQAAPWVYNPWLDLIVGCGAWSAPLLLLSYSTVASSARTWSFVFYGLAFLFNYPHYMATIYRAYHRTEDFEKYRVFTVHITGLVLLTLLLSHFWSGLLPWIFTIYITWSPWHYSGQNYGLMMMFARRAGADPDKNTRRVLYAAFVVSYLILFVAFHTGVSSDPLFLSLGIPATVSRWEQMLLVMWFVVLSAVGLTRLARQTGWRKLLPSLTLFSSQFLWFLLPAVMTLLRRLSLPQNRYSTGVLAVMHSAQYLWITSYYARREAAGTEHKGSGWRPFAYFGVLIVGGIALFVPGPWLASKAFHYDFSSSFLIFTSLVNIHHFILDGAIWKLRDGRIASLLLNSKDRVADAMSEAGGGLAKALRWLASARKLQFAAVALLLVWGTLDQTWHYLSLHSDDLADLRRAAKLDSFDSPLQTRLARRALEVGDTQTAEVAWKQALQANPADSAPRQALLKFLIEQKRFDEAYTLTEASLKYTPNDANLLVDRGLLRLQRGQTDQALADWNQALAEDPNQALAHLYLAHEMDRQGNAQTAAAHYKNFLDLVARVRIQDRPAPEVVIGIVLRMADCQARSSQTDVAIKSYQMAEKLSEQTGQKRLEGVASLNEAALQAKGGKVGDALRLYQHTLALDETIGDKSASAVDWFAYGEFLEQAGFPDRLAYACMVKSGVLAQSVPDASLPNAALSARAQLEKKMGPAAVAVRQNPEPAVAEALQVRR